MSTFQNSPSIDSPAWEQRVALLFETARTLSPQERQRFYDRERLVPEVRVEMERLVSADAAADEAGFLVHTVSYGGQDTLEVTSDFSHSHETADGDLPSSVIGKYQLIELLGRGGFGDVFLALDSDLQIQVAIKVANRRSGDFDSEMFLQEARTVARLNHPHIVPVRHFGQTEDGQCFVVSNYIDGGDLAARIKDEERLPWDESARLIASIAEALYHAHAQSIYHRDVKPSNILLDCTGKAFLTDFGIALTEADYGKVERQAGTYPYMSPEQVKNEGHLVDGRSDVFSLGIVLYELLTGERPFRGKTLHEVRQLIKKAEPRPPRELDNEIPKELERICLKALEKKRTFRYATAWDMAQELWDFVGREQPAQGARPAPLPPLKKPVIPRGLRSFESEDQGFFLELLPGPRDMDGLPQSIRFWKTRIEQHDVQRTFRVGFLYGPSGCGKSSLIKAGLIPQLSYRVIPIYVESSEGETEARLLAQLRHACPEISHDLSLAESVAALRCGTGLPAGRKALLILDQFEQWLHGHRGDHEAELIDALRQCDGAHVQCLISVRADFWMAVARLADQLDVGLADGVNLAKVDLFDEHHARKVLTAFGRAYGTLPADPEPLSASQKSFVERSVSGLAEQGRIICVHLALFAEMVRSRTWSPEVLENLGGAKGVGCEFLKESFGGELANPRHRLHKDHAQGILESLLPEHGSGIRGPQKSEQELLRAAGCRDQKSFRDVIHILNDELRLITPTELSDEPQDGHRFAGRYYQLTHDYLVPSIRDWIAEDSITTVSGRARLRLKQRALVWGGKRETKYLPGLWEYLRFRCLTSPVRWDSVQQEMMRRAGFFHAVRTLSVLAILLVLGVTGYQMYARQQAGQLVRGVLSADLGELSNVIAELEDYRLWADPQLHGVAEDEAAERQRRLKASLALVPRDPGQLTYLKPQLFNCEVNEFGIIRDALAEYRNVLRADLWQVLHDPGAHTRVRFHAGLALADYAPDAEEWTPADAEFLVAQMLDANTDEHPTLRRYLRGIAPQLLDPLTARFKDHSAREAIQDGAANALVDFAADDPERLARLACDATPTQHRILCRWLTDHATLEDKVLVEETLQKVVAERPAEDAPDAVRVSLGRRRAGAAITLLQMDRKEAALEVFRITDDPEALTQFVHGHRPRRVTPQSLLDCLQLATERREVTARYGLIMALGEFAFDELPATGRELCCEKLFRWHAEDSSSAIHAACEWVLERWDVAGEADVANRARGTLLETADRQREWFVPEIPGVQLTFVTLAPGEFVMGSPPYEEERDKRNDEQRRRVSISRPFAMAAREITVAEWKLFQQSRPEGERGIYGYDEQISPSDDCSVNSLDWYLAVEFCRWLTSRAGMPESAQCYLDPQTIPAAEMIQLEDGRTVPTSWPFFPERPGYRLPTEAEWELACRGGMQTAFSFGSDRSLLGHYAWCKVNSGGQAHPVRELRPNLRGLFDTHGNAWEWCHDWYAADLPSTQVDPIGPSDGKERLIRGGGWRSDTRACRAADRSRANPVYRNSLIGFRVVRTLDDEMKTP